MLTLRVGHGFVGAPKRAVELRNGQSTAAIHAGALISDLIQLRLSDFLHT